MIFWSDVTTDTIHRATMNGTEEEIIASTDLISVGMSNIYSTYNDVSWYVKYIQYLQRCQLVCQIYTVLTTM